VVRVLPPPAFSSMRPLGAPLLAVVMVAVARALAMMRVNSGWIPAGGVRNSK
jgi:ABC-type uncharacterized transport system YnjBCD permease subunit